MINKPFINEKKVKDLVIEYMSLKNNNLSNYTGVNNLHQNQQINDTLIHLYREMEPTLKWTITGDITKVYSQNARAKKFYNLNKIQIQNAKSTKYKINFTEYSQKYLHEFLNHYGYAGDNIKQAFSLLYPFWEVLEGLSLQGIVESSNKYKCQYSYYIAIKFCDKYWDFIYCCLKRDLKFETILFSEIESRYSKENCKFDIDRYLFENGIYEESNFDNGNILEGLLESLDPKEKELLELLLQGYSYTEIATLQNKSICNIYTIKHRIIKKLVKTAKYSVK